MGVLGIVDILGFVVLFFALIIIGILQTAVVVGLMFGMHHGMREQFEDDTYGDLDLDDFQRPAFNEVIARLAIFFLSTTVVIHLVEHFVMGMSVRRHKPEVFIVLFLLETLAIAIGVRLMFGLDKFRWMMITVVSA